MLFSRKTDCCQIPIEKSSAGEVLSKERVASGWRLDESGWGRGAQLVTPVVSSGSAYLLEMIGAGTRTVLRTPQKLQRFDLVSAGRLESANG
jgi:hypothetical protein